MRRYGTGMNDGRISLKTGLFDLDAAGLVGGKPAPGLFILDADRLATALEVRNWVRMRTHSSSELRRWVKQRPLSTERDFPHIPRFGRTFHSTSAANRACMVSS